MKLIIDSHCYWIRRRFKTQDPKLASELELRGNGSLEQRTVTICSGLDYVNINYNNFVARNEETANVRTLLSLGISGRRSIRKHSTWHCTAAPTTLWRCSKHIALQYMAASFGPPIAPCFSIRIVNLMLHIMMLSDNCYKNIDGVVHRNFCI